MAMKKRVRAYVAPANLMYSWPEVAAKAGLQVQIDSNAYTVALPGLSNGGSITCRSGKVCRGGICIKVYPSAGAHAASRAAVAGKPLILIFYSAKGRSKEPNIHELALAREFGRLLIDAGATPVLETGEFQTP